MNEKLVIPAQVFAIMLPIIVFATAATAYLTPIETGLPWRSVFWGIINAIGIGTLGYLKTTKPEDFDPVKFLITVIVGAISGYTTYVLGWTPEELET